MKTGTAESLTITDVRLVNKKNIFTDIVKSEGITRNTLSQLNNISIMTVKNIVDELLSDNLVEENVIKSAVGRKPMALSLNSSFGNIVCINISSVNSITYVIYDMQENLLKQEKIRFKNRDISFEEKLSEVIAQVLYEVKIISTITVGLAVFVPGVYNEEADKVEFAANKELDNVHIKTLLKEAFQIDNIAIIHDTHASAMSEYELDRSVNSQFYLYCGDGVGGALTINGENVQGDTMLAGEVGNSRFINRRNGTVETLEDMVSIPGIRSRITASYQSLEAEELFTLYNNGLLDKDSTIVITEALEMIAMYLYNIIWFCNPEKIVVDSYSEAYVDAIIQFAKDYFDEMFSSIPYHMGTIEKVKCDEYHTMIGCMRSVRVSWIETVVQNPETLAFLHPQKKEGVV